MAVRYCRCCNKRYLVIKCDCKYGINDGKLINTDVNGAFQIMRKVFPNVSADGIEGVVLRPVVVVAA